MQTLNLSRTSGLLDLSKSVSNLSTIKCVLNWNPSPIGGRPVDLDIFAFVLDRNRKISGSQDVVFFNNKNAPGVIYPRDSRTGEGPDDEELLLNLPKLEPGKERVDVYVFVFEAASRLQTLDGCQDAMFSVIDTVTTRVLQTYRLTDYKGNTGVFLGSFAKQNGSWFFEPEGNAGNQDPNGVVGVYL